MPILPIFPEGGLTSSVITTVWVGVFVLAFFNLRFGWVLSGLVVPGYIVPLLIVRPIAAGVIVVEAVITYLIVYWFSERLARGRFNALFGRDRFMGLVLVSIAVRALFDGMLLPELADWLAVHWDRQLDWHSNLQSFGLVVISLMANQLWKPGLVRGLFSAVVTIGITWLIVRYGLMEFTNFRLSGVSYVYEGLASSILASPKAYIILVLTAFIASQMNVRYGWDFSGILIPALIALQWYQPAKVLSSFVEAGVIYFLAQAVMKLPFFASMTIEGARKLVIFFNVSFVYKLLLGHGLNLLDLDVKTTDFYGFGYLLSTLLAIKAYDKDIFPRVMRSTLEVSVAGAVAGNLVGFILTLVLPASQPALAAKSRLEPGSDSARLAAEAAGGVHLAKGGLSPPPWSLSEARSIGDAIDLLEAGAQPDFVAGSLAQNGLALRAQADGTLAVSRRTMDGSGLLLFNPGGAKRLAIVVNDAAALPGMANAGLSLQHLQQARWLVLGSPLVPDRPGQPSLQQILRDKLRLPELELSFDQQAKARLVLSGNSAGALDLKQLRSRFPGLESRFDESAAANRARLDLGPERFASLAATGLVEPATELAECIAGPPSVQDTTEPDLSRLAFLRFEVVEPLVAALNTGKPVPKVARRNAAMLGWQLDRCLSLGAEHWRLAAGTGSQGLFLFADKGDRRRVVEAESQSSDLLPFALAFQRDWRAGALVVAPHETALTGSQRSAFGVISQALLRSIKPDEARLVQIRRASFPAEGLPPGSVALVPDRLEARRAWMDELAALTLAEGYRPVPVDGGKGSAGLEVAQNLSIRYFSETGRGRYATMWLAKGTVTATEAAP